MAARRPRPEDRLLAELASWGGTFRPGLERQGVVRTEDGLEVEISIRVRRHTGAAQAAELREEALAWLRETVAGYPNAFQAERCDCYLRSGGRCDGRVVAVVVHRLFLTTGSNCFRFICGRHREKHGIEPSRVVGVVELPEHTLVEAHDLVKRWTEARETERQALIGEHRQGAHGLLPAGIVPAKKCTECEDLAYELSTCRSHSPTSGRRCHEDQGHLGRHRRNSEEWS
jgi:hypothetical protein